MWCLISGPISLTILELSGFKLRMLELSYGNGTIRAGINIRIARIKYGVFFLLLFGGVFGTKEMQESLTKEARI